MQDLPPIEPSSFDPASLSKVQKILANPAGAISGRSSFDALQRYEEIEPGRPLDSEYGWFCLGLAYAMVKVDRSLFEVFMSAANQNFRLRTYGALRPLCSVPGSEYHTNPWSGTVQGIPAASHRGHDLPQVFADFVSSYQFKRKDTGHTWRIRFQSLEVPDPFSPGHGATIHYALPVNETKRRKMVLGRTTEGYPEFGMANV